MIIGLRLRQLREAKGFSQGDIEKRTGLFRCYTSRVENGGTVPSVGTLEKYAAALEIPLYKFFFDGYALPEAPKLPAKLREPEVEVTGKERREFRAFAKAIGRLDQRQRQLLLAMAVRLARKTS